VIGDVRAATPVLLLRPLAGTMGLWGAFRDGLAKRHPVIACHHRGVGSSPPATVATSTRTMGGMVATWLAIDRPDLVAGLVVASAPARGTDAMRSLASPRVSAAERSVRMVTSLARREGDREAGLAEQVLSERFRMMEPARTAEILEQLRSDGGSLRVVLQHAAAAALHDVRHDVGRIRAPALCLAGGLDELVPAAAIADLARAIPSARFDVIADAGHDLSLEAPDELARRVSSFFSSLHN
jgi:3-oxoadipate enol-lactonase / 4-carboxymuconolactone decarboxylase